MMLASNDTLLVVELNRDTYRKATWSPSRLDSSKIKSIVIQVYPHLNNIIKAEESTISVQTALAMGHQENGL
jgi:hypothetical protein